MEVNDALITAAFSGGVGSGGGGVNPTGTIEIDDNGTYNVRNYASAEINVPLGVFPTGQKTVAENGTYDVYSYASVDVQVPQDAGLKKIYITCTRSCRVNAMESIFGKVKTVRSEISGAVRMPFNIPDQAQAAPAYIVIETMGGTDVITGITGYSGNLIGSGNRVAVGVRTGDDITISIGPA